ncbi:hypothetical protein K503DRAFT_267913 [Rhizopogon vinicolor AM-OR11-026]|uniref:Uncharacterized protein n=1 Tax=Rhizopogon vinicolor AM-OR11-026 TaxID=1314800 RepID=A0A1B7MWD1_9AGAM|nr:hypothetical protein K503DRAFT_267913 [Rhizopogon vinicolor AM-OR11-026]
MRFIPQFTIALTGVYTIVTMAVVLPLPADQAAAIAKPVLHTPALETIDTMSGAHDLHFVVVVVDFAESYGTITSAPSTTSSASASQSPHDTHPSSAVEAQNASVVLQPSGLAVPTLTSTTTRITSRVSSVLELDVVSMAPSTATPTESFEPGIIILGFVLFVMLIFFPEIIRLVLETPSSATAILAPYFIVVLVIIITLSVLIGLQY